MNRDRRGTNKDRLRTQSLRVEEGAVQVSEPYKYTAEPTTKWRATTSKTSSWSQPRANKKLPPVWQGEIARHEILQIRIRCVFLVHLVSLFRVPLSFLCVCIHVHHECRSGFLLLFCFFAGASTKESKGAQGQFDLLFARGCARGCARGLCAFQS